MTFREYIVEGKVDLYGEFLDKIENESLTDKQRTEIEIYLGKMKRVHFDDAYGEWGPYEMTDSLDTMTNKQQDEFAKFLQKLKVV